MQTPLHNSGVSVAECPGVGGGVGQDGSGFRRRLPPHPSLLTRRLPLRVRDGEASKLGGGRPQKLSVLVGAGHKIANF